MAAGIGWRIFYLDWCVYIKDCGAGVAELADAQDLGSCGLKTVEVQILSPAPGLFRNHTEWFESPCNLLALAACDLIFANTRNHD